MIKNLTAAIIPALALIALQSACAQPPECPPPNELRLIVGQYQLNLNEKKPICVTVPGTFKIRIINPPNSDVNIGVGEVTVEAKSGAGLSITGSNAAAVKKVTVVVAGSAEKGDEFSFLIRVAGVGVLDPKVRVVDNDTMFLLKSEAFYDALNTLDLSLEEANKLIPPQRAAE